jgi:hypothetical protein
LGRNDANDGFCKQCRLNRTRPGVDYENGGYVSQNYAAAGWDNTKLGGQRICLVSAKLESWRGNKMTDYVKEPSALCLGDSKQPALYFDRVFPLFQGEELPFEVWGNLMHGAQTNVGNKINAKEWFTQLLLETMTEGLISKASFEQIDGDLANSSVKTDALHAIPEEQRRRKNLALIFSVFYMSNIRMQVSEETRVQQYVREKLSRINISDVSIILPEYLLLKGKVQSEDLTLTLTNIPLVDTTNATWEQILELRRDREAFKKLRDLRLFLNKNYEGKSQAFIEDDFGRLLDEHNQASKEYGFDNKVSVLSQVLSSKLLQTSTAASIAFAVTGQRLPATLTGVSTGVLAAFEVLRVGIEVVKGRHALRRLKDSHELAYIIEAKRKLESSA